MKTEYFSLEGLPALLLGEPSDGVWLYVHGKQGSKEEARAFADRAVPRGRQVLAVDLPEHGERRGGPERLVPWQVVPELQRVLAHARKRWSRVALRGESIGAWFSLLAFGQTGLERCLLVSPVLDMPGLIEKMMGWAGVTEEELRRRGEIPTDFGETLSRDYYDWALAHPVDRWATPTAVLWAGGDHLTDRETVERFALRFSAELTVMEQGEHWFHTPEQLAFLNGWQDSRL